jgi:hypothetical protein
MPAIFACDLGTRSHLTRLAGRSQHLLSGGRNEPASPVSRTDRALYRLPGSICPTAGFPIVLASRSPLQGLALRRFGLGCDVFVPADPSLNQAALANVRRPQSLAGPPGPFRAANANGSRADGEQHRGTRGLPFGVTHSRIPIAPATSNAAAESLFTPRPHRGRVAARARDSDDGRLHNLSRHVRFPVNRLTGGDVDRWRQATASLLSCRVPTTDGRRRPTNEAISGSHRRL